MAMVARVRRCWYEYPSPMSFIAPAELNVYRTELANKLLKLRQERHVLNESFNKFENVLLVKGYIEFPQQSQILMSKEDMLRARRRARPGRYCWLVRPDLRCGVVGRDRYSAAAASYRSFYVRHASGR